MFRKQAPEPERSPLPVRAVSAAGDLARRGVDMTRDTVHKELLERAKSQEALSDEQIWRRYQFRHLAAFITIPALLLGTASIAAAYGSGLMRSEPKVICQPIVVPAPPVGSFKVTVLNASSQDGAGQVVGRDLSRRGFVLGAVSTAPRTLYVKAPARIYHGRAGLDQALLVAQTIAGAEIENDGRPGTGVALVIGTDFTKMLPAPPPKPPSQDTYKVNVYNATWRSGLAKSTLAELTARGFSPGKQGNDPDKSFLPNDVAVILHGPDADLAAAQVQSHIKGSVLKEVTRDNMTVDVILGNLYAGVIPTAELPPKQAVRKDPPPTVSRPCE